MKTEAGILVRQREMVEHITLDGLKKKEKGQQTRKSRSLKAGKAREQDFYRLSRSADLPTPLF